MLYTEVFSLSFKSEYSVHTGGNGEPPFSTQDSAQADASFVLPWGDGTTEIVLLHGEQLLASHTVSGHKSEVEFTSLTAAQTWDADTVQTISWNAADAKEARFRVVATDGVNIAAPESAAVQIPVSNTLDGIFYIDSLQQALTLGKPEIFNRDQGSRFTSLAYTEILQAENIRISMDGRGRALDNIFIERLGALWARSLNYEEIYLYNHATVPLLEAGLTRYSHAYNWLQPHQSLNYRLPSELYFAA